MISDLEARKIASHWYDSQSSALYAFASTGAINSAHPTHDMEAEIADIYWNISDRVAHAHLNALDAYVKEHVNGNSERPPVPGWDKIIW